MTRYRMALKAILIVVVLALGIPAGVAAAHNTPHTNWPATATPLNKNLLHNAGFETVGTGGVIPSWTPVTGSAHVETFGTRAWPTQAYGTSYKGGLRYVACGAGAGSVSQTVPFDVGDTPSPYLTARLKVNFGGKIGHIMKVTITITDGASQHVSKSKTRVLDTSNHYKNGVATLGIPAWATQITATLTMTPKAGASSCQVVADSVQLYAYIFS